MLLIIHSPCGSVEYAVNCWKVLMAGMLLSILWHISWFLVIINLMHRYCEERPLLLGNAGMGARLCTYYQKFASGDQTLSSLRNGNHGMGSLLTLDPADKSPFLGDIGPGCSQSCIETNMYRAPVFQHKLSSTDYILVRSAKGTLSLRRIDKSYVVGQQVSVTLAWH